MKIVRLEAREKWAFDKIKSWLTQRPRSADGWHVSDLLYPRKAFFQRTDPQPLTDDQSLYFVAGHGHHHIIEAIMGPRKEGKAKERTDAGEFKKVGIYFSPDLRGMDSLKTKGKLVKVPIEIKTTRSQKTPDDMGKNPKQAFESYLKQLCSYMALMNKGLGYLLVLYLARKNPDRAWGTKPALRFYQVKMSAEERKEKQEEIVSIAKNLTAAVNSKKCSKLPLCAEWLCRDCPWIKKCKPWTLEPKRKKYLEQK